MYSKLFTVFIVFGFMYHAVAGKFEYSLDTFEDVMGGWKLNRNHSFVEQSHWFAYFDSLEEMSPEGKLRFKSFGVDLSDLKGATGVWAAFYLGENELPYSGLQYPEMILRSAQILEQVEITYYVHGNGSIKVVSTSKEVIRVLEGSDPYGQWRTETFGLGGKEASKFVLQANGPEDCVLVDKIIVKS